MLAWHTLQSVLVIIQLSFEHHHALRNLLQLALYYYFAIIYSRSINGFIGKQIKKGKHVFCLLRKHIETDTVFYKNKGVESDLGSKINEEG